MNEEQSKWRLQERIFENAYFSDIHPVQFINNSYSRWNLGQFVIYVDVPIFINECKWRQYKICF